MDEQAPALESMLAGVPRRAVTALATTEQIAEERRAPLGDPALSR